MKIRPAIGIWCHAQIAAVGSKSTQDCLIPQDAVTIKQATHVLFLSGRPVHC